MFRLKIALLPVLLGAVLYGSTGCAYTIPGNVESLGSLLSSMRSASIISAANVDVALSNVRSGGTIQSGFLKGTANTPGLNFVEVAVDSGAYTAATGTTNWTWQLPTGPTGMRLGTTHTLRVRVWDVDGNYSEPISFTIKKGVNKDVNGDGYPDLLVGAIMAAGGGRAYIFHGGSSGPGTRNASAADTIITGEGGGFLAVGVMLADVNGDGYADAIANDPSIGDGRMYIFHSRGSAGIASMGAASADAVIQGQSGATSGSRLAATDLNNDGYTDIAAMVGGGNGAVHIYQSTGEAGIPSQSTTAATVIISAATSGTGFGFSMDLGDINGDGFPDLVVGAHFVSSFSGRAYIFLSSGGALTSRTTAAADATINGEGGGSRLGADCLVTDLNGDGFADLVVTSTQYSSAAGRVYVFYSAGTSGIASALAAAAPLTITGNTSSNFGADVAAGDIDGDGNMELVVGSPGYPTPNDSGGAFVYYNVSSLSSGNASPLAGAIFTGAILDQNQSGGGVALIDMNGDGYQDVITGSGNGGTEVDEVHYFRAPGSGIIASQDLGSGGTTDATLTGETVNGRFGGTLSR